MKNRKEINYEEMIRTLAKDPRVRRMAAYPQHGGVSTLEHAESVTRMSFRINAALHLNANPKTLLYGGMLHDYYLYDWHHHAGHLHGLTHPEAALERAEKDFDLPEGAKQVIRTHMWPLTLFHIPMSREAGIVCLADKVSAVWETLGKRGRS